MSDAFLPAEAETWVITEGAAGMENQALGLAERLSLPVSIKRVGLKTPWRWLAPRSLGSPFGQATPQSSALAPPWPRLIIGCGRQSIPFVSAIRQISKGATIAVQCQRPRTAAAKFDLVIPPEHDGLAGPNIFPILGSPNRITQTSLSQARAQFTPLFKTLRQPRLAVLIGGKSKAYPFTPDESRRLAAVLQTLSRDFGLMVTASRRTSDETRQRIADAIGSGAYFWNGDGENPYQGMLAWADAFLVTGDSVNLACEAAATGKPVHIFPLEGGSKKFRKFHDSLQQRGITRPFRGKIERWNYEPLDETGRAAKRIQSLLDARASATDMKA